MIILGRQISWPVTVAAAVLCFVSQLPGFGQPGWSFSVGLGGPLIVGWIGGRKVARSVPRLVEPANFGQTNSEGAPK